MTDIEHKQFQALKEWYAKRKEKLIKLGWKYSGESYIHEDGVLIVVLLCGKNKHYLQVTIDGNVSFAPTTMNCF